MPFLPGCLSLIQAVLREVVAELGGWKAAVYLDGGEVNVDVNAGTWPTENQVQRCFTFRSSSNRVSSTDAISAPTTSLCGIRSHCYLSYLKEYVSGTTFCSFVVEVIANMTWCAHFDACKVSNFIYASVFRKPRPF